MPPKKKTTTKKKKKKKKKQQQQQQPQDPSGSPAAAAPGRPARPAERRHVTDRELRRCPRFDIVDTHADRVTSLSFAVGDLDCGLLFSGSADNTVKVWKRKDRGGLDWAHVHTLEGHTGPVGSVHASASLAPLGGVHIYTGSDDRTIKIWLWPSNNHDALSDAFGRDIQNTQTLHGHTNFVRAVCASADGTHVYSGSFDNTVRVWQTATGTCARTLTGHTNSVNTVCASPDGARIFSGGCDNTIRVWDTATWACALTLQGHSDWVRSVCASADSAHLYSGSDDQTIRVWRVSGDDAGECTQTLLSGGHSWGVGTVCAPSDGTALLYSGSRDKTAKVWDLATGQCVRTLRGHAQEVLALCYCVENGDAMLFSGGQDTTVRLMVLPSPSNDDGEGDTGESKNTDAPPPTPNMAYKLKIKEAILAMKERNGSSLPAIKKALGADQSQWRDINAALRSGVADGTFVKNGGLWKVSKEAKKLPKNESKDTDAPPPTPNMAWKLRGTEQDFLESARPTLPDTADASYQGTFLTDVYAEDSTIKTPEFLLFAEATIGVLKQTHPGHHILLEGLLIMEDIATGVFTSIADRASEITTADETCGMLRHSVRRAAVTGDEFTEALSPHSMEHTFGIFGVRNGGLEYFVVARDEYDNGFDDSGVQGWESREFVQKYLPRAFAAFVALSKADQDLKFRRWTQDCVEETRKRTQTGEITAGHCMAAVQMVLPGELRKHAVSTAQKFLMKHNVSVCTDEEDDGTVSRSDKIGLVLDVDMVGTLLGKYTGKPVDLGGAVCLAAVVEYVLAEHLELAGTSAVNCDCHTVTARHLILMTFADEELDTLFKNCCGAGFVTPQVRPYINKTIAGSWLRQNEPESDVYWKYLVKEWIRDSGSGSDSDDDDDDDDSTCEQLLHTFVACNAGNEFVIAPKLAEEDKTTNGRKYCFNSAVPTSWEAIPDGNNVLSEHNYAVRGPDERVEPGETVLEGQALPYFARAARAAAAANQGQGEQKSGADDGCTADDGDGSQLRVRFRREQPRKRENIGNPLENMRRSLPVHVLQRIAARAGVLRMGSSSYANLHTNILVWMQRLVEKLVPIARVLHDPSRISADDVVLALSNGRPGMPPRGRCSALVGTGRTLLNGGAGGTLARAPVHSVNQAPGGVVDKYLERTTKIATNKRFSPDVIQYCGHGSQTALDDALRGDPKHNTDVPPIDASSWFEETTTRTVEGRLCQEMWKRSVSLVQAMQNSTARLIPFDAVDAMLKDVALELFSSEMRVSPAAVNLVDAALEWYLVDLLECAVLNALHDRRTIVYAKDIELARRHRGERT